MSKLLDKSFRIFLLYAAIVLTCSIPAYYGIVDYIWQTELKEHNLLVSSEIKHNVQSLPFPDNTFDQSIGLWNQLQPSARIQEEDWLKPDSIYNIYRNNHFSGKKERFQGLITYFEWKEKVFSVAVETNMEESHETILGLALVSLIFFMLLLAGLIILNRRLSARIWQPFKDSLAKIREFDLNSEQPVVFDKTNIIEFTALNTSLAQLIDGNIKSYRQQKHFVENASHELQTPLAIVQSKFDLFLQDAQLSQSQSEMIDQAQTALDRVIRINKNMLLLAKIEHQQFPDMEWLDAAKIISSNLDLMDLFIEGKQLVVKKELAENVKIKANKMLFEMLISNLLTNAIRYSPHKEEVLIYLSQDCLVVSNSGIAALQEDNLFKRFGRVNNQAPVTGLGLAIVLQICTQYGWEIRYSFESEQHCFLVNFIGLH